MTDEQIELLAESFAKQTLNHEPTVYEASCFEIAIRKVLKQPSEKDSCGVMDLDGRECFLGFGHDGPHNFPE